MACAVISGRIQLRQGRVQAGLALLDEAMLAAIEGELSPIMTGLIYCSLIEACHDVFAWSRAREWTFALSRWCDQQRGMVAFTGTCLVRRAEIMRLQGAWPNAMAEANRREKRWTLRGGSTEGRNARLRGEVGPRRVSEAPAAGTRTPAGTGSPADVQGEPMPPAQRSGES
jgi:hypothetical protein